MCERTGVSAHNKKKTIQNTCMSKISKSSSPSSRSWVIIIDSACIFQLLKRSSEVRTRWRHSPFPISPCSRFGRHSFLQFSIPGALRLTLFPLPSRHEKEKRAFRKRHKRKLRRPPNRLKHNPSTHKRTKARPSLPLFPSLSLTHPPLPPQKKKGDGGALHREEQAVLIRSL